MTDEQSPQSNEKAQPTAFAIICSQAAILQDAVISELVRLHGTFRDIDLCTVSVVGRQILPWVNFEGPDASLSSCLKQRRGLTNIKHNATDCILFDAFHRAVNKLNNEPKDKFAKFELIVIADCDDLGSKKQDKDVVKLFSTKSNLLDIVLIRIGNAQLSFQKYFPRVCQLGEYRAEFEEREIPSKMESTETKIVSVFPAVPEDKEKAGPMSQTVQKSASHTNDRKNQDLNANLPKTELNGNISASNLLLQNRKDGEPVVLLIGETGSGKSTFINAFANYVRFDTFDKAISSNTADWKIPFCYRILDDQLNFSKMVRVGNCQRPEDNATKEPEAYRIEYPPGSLVTFVDTPGMGDYRGFDVDKQNFNKTVNYLRNNGGAFKPQQIRAVLCFAHTNETRLTDFFQYCIGETMNFLKETTSLNSNCEILFAFTHCVGSDYNPGNSLSFVRTEAQKYGIKVSPRNVFCFDNECVRIMAANENGVTDTAEDILESCRQSWEKSKGECRRLIKHLMSTNEALSSPNQ